MKYILENPVKGTIGRQKYKTSISWRNGVLITDEPEKLGGMDLGPDPYTLLLSSLAGCTLATLRMYIDHKGMDVENIDVEANAYFKIENKQMVAYIDRKISFPTPPDSVTKERLIRVAENCPISKMLKGEIKITTQITE